MDKVTNLNVGAINPYALTEALVGRKIDWNDKNSILIMEDALETNFGELFDMKFNSPIYAGLKLNAQNMAEPVAASEITIRGDNETETPDVSSLKTLSELKNLGVKDVSKTKISSGVLSKGVLNLKLNIPEIDKTMSKTRLSKSLASIVRSAGAAGDWTPTNGIWKDMGDFFKDVTEFSDPIQGAIGNCYFIAAVSAVAWADPYLIVHRNRATGVGETDRVNAIQFYSKGGGKDAPSKLVEVTDSTLVNSASNLPIYCRSRDAGEIYPALYEKAFAKWILKTDSDKPDITQTAFGDPVKACAQLNNKTPYYFNTASRTGDQLYTIVRENSMSYKTIHPMTAWTYGSGKDYTGTNVVGNHAYTVLGWAFQNNKKFIVLRNPWGVTEPAGLNTYQGVLSFFDSSFWRPVTMVGNDGIFAIEANSFQNLFAGLGVAK
jgi:hypothetical protein